MQSKPTPTPAFMSCKEVAAHLRLSLGTISRLVTSGQLRCHRFGRTYRIPKDSVEDYVRRCEMGGGK